MNFKVSAVVILSFSIMIGCSPDPTAVVEESWPSHAEISAADHAFRSADAVESFQTVPRVRFIRIPHQPHRTEVEFFDESLAFLPGVPLSVTLGVRGSAGAEYGTVIPSGPSRYRIQLDGRFIDDWQGEIVSIRIDYGEPGGKTVRSSSFDVFVLKSGVAPLQAPSLTGLRVIQDASKGFPSIIRVTVSDDPAGRVAAVKLEVAPIEGASEPPTVEPLAGQAGNRTERLVQWRVSSSTAPAEAVYRLGMTMLDTGGKQVGSSLVHATDFVSSSDRWLASLDGRLVFDQKQGWSLVVFAEPRKGLGKYVEKVTGKITGVADAVAPKPDLFELKASGVDADGRQIYRSSVLEFPKDPRDGIFRVDLEFTFSQPVGGRTKVRYGQCWVFAGQVTTAS